ncbi:MAG: Wzz/FepE/Etk N-terminal domain-containing protein [Balneolaceae bacterium]
MSRDQEPNDPGKPERPPQEIRYVPVEYMPHMQDDEDEIDLMELAKTIWDRRRTIAKITGVFILIGLFIALFSPVEYESEAVLMPEAQQEQGSGANRLLQQFGGAFGLGGGGGTMQQGMIPPMIYPRIVSSLSFQLELLEREVHFREYGVTTTWPDFLENHYSKPLTAYAKEYTIGLPITVLGGLRGLFTDEEQETTSMETDPFAAEFISITREQQKLVESLRERISVSQDQETGLLTTQVKLQDPRASAEMNRHLIELLKEYVTDYRVEKARQTLEFVENSHRQARERFEAAQVELADFQDSNVVLSTRRAETELERLQDEKDLAFNVYNSLAQRLEEARLTLQEQTPIFKEVQAVNVPSQRSEPNRPLILIITAMLGGILSIGWIFISPLIDQFQAFRQG